MIVTYQIEDTEAGDNGWSPVFSVVADGARRVLQVASWVGGTGSAPASGKYVGTSGLVTLIADGVDIRGGTGAQGIQGIQGITGATGASTVLRGSFTIPEGDYLNVGTVINNAEGQNISTIRALCTGNLNASARVQLCLFLSGVTHVLATITPTTSVQDMMPTAASMAHWLDGVTSYALIARVHPSDTPTTGAATVWAWATRAVP